MDRTSGGTESNICCRIHKIHHPPQVPKPDLDLHHATEHASAMFVCGFCDDDDDGNRHFEEMAAAREHIKSEHKIKKDAMVDKAIKVII